MQTKTAIPARPIALPPPAAVWLGLLLLAGVVITALAAWPQVAFQPAGNTADYFQRQAGFDNRPAIAWPAAKITQPLEAVDLTIWFLQDVETFYAPEIFATRLERGQTADGQLAYFIEFDEAGLNQYLNYWFGAWANDYVHFRDTEIDLKPNGMIIYGDVDLGTHWQRVGAVFNLDETGRQFTFVGVDIDGQLLSVPPAGPIALGVNALITNGNRALLDLKLVDPEGTLTLQQIVLTEDGAQIVAR